jgi:hypothetical protein
MVFGLFNLLAVVAHTILDLGDRLYQHCRAQESPRKLWNELRTLMHWVVVQGWPRLLLFYLEDEGTGPWGDRLGPGPTSNSH